MKTTQMFLNRGLDLQICNIYKMGYYLLIQNDQCTEVARNMNEFQKYYDEPKKSDEKVCTV